MPRPFSPIRIVLLIHLMLVSVASLGAAIEQQRALYLRAEQAIKQGQAAEADGLMAELVDYPLFPYLLYQKLERALGDTPSVENFLTRYGNTRLAHFLRQRWLERLATQGAWVKYAENYRDSENPKLQCNYYLALAQIGRMNEALAGAEKLWPTGTSLPESCERLFLLWQASPGFTTEHIWRRFALALQADNMPLASDLPRLLPPELLAQAELWRQVHSNPRLVLSCSALNPQLPKSGPIFAHGIDRLAADDPLLAQTAWALHQDRFAIAPDEAARIDRRTALALAGQRFDQAGAYLLELPAGHTDAQIRGWRVRAALSRQDWPGVLEAIERLQPEEKKQAQWLYWKARALENLGDSQVAMEAYRLAAKERDYYGFNAADHIGVDYALSAKPETVGEVELNGLAESPPFLVIRELLALHREAESRSEWFHAIKSLSPDGLRAAAKLAQRWGLDNLAINTAAKAGHWDDLDLRFPLGSDSLVLQAAQSQQADPAMIYALVRRESAFDPNAGSPVGAKGLMQLMPSTGELMARRLNEMLPSPNALLEPERNLRYGIAYFKELLEKFGNHFALAATAYNAGPNRVERWLPTDRTLPADLWVETLPISETRQYVAAVLSYAVIYQMRLGQPLRRIAGFLPDVAPGSKPVVKPDRLVSVQVCD
jgi:soluble lytic murein transglycosylase